MSYLQQSLLAVKEDPTELNTQFFSDANIDKVQCAIQRIVRLNGYDISKQSSEHLITIMQYVYNVHGRFRNTVDALNKIVLDQSVPIVISNIKQRIQYDKDRTKSLKPMPRSVSTSIKGNNTVIRDVI